LHGNLRHHCLYVNLNVLGATNTSGLRLPFMNAGLARRFIAAGSWASADARNSKVSQRRAAEREDNGRGEGLRTGSV
jgi:hypothetical protein